MNDNIKIDVSETIKNKIHDFSFLAVPIIKVLPSIAFRILSFWLILSYLPEFYNNEEGNGPGLGLFLPLFLIGIIMLVNFITATKFGLIGLKAKEALVNSVCNIILPVYGDMYFEVRIT